MSALKTAKEMETIRATQAKIREQELKDFVPEPLKSYAVGYYEVRRYGTGQIKGLYITNEIPRVEAEKRLKGVKRIHLKDGTDMFQSANEIRASIHSKL